MFRKARSSEGCACFQRAKSAASAGAASKKQSLKQDQALALEAGAAAPRALRTAAFIHADELQELAMRLAWWKTVALDGFDASD